MAHVADRSQPLQPITLRDALVSVGELIEAIIAKSKTLIDYYIRPNPVPNNIAAYKPSLEILHSRLESLSRLNPTHLALLLDDASALIASYLQPIIEQLKLATQGLQDAFATYWDPDLRTRAPYDAILFTLARRDHQLRAFVQAQLQQPQRRPAEAMISTPSPGQLAFCRSAVQFVKYQDTGKISIVPREQLNTEQRSRLQTLGGAYLNWDCASCSFQLQYHVSSSSTSNILTTEDVRSHLDVPHVEYRSAWLVKCHLFQTRAYSRNVAESSDRRRNSTNRRNSTTVRRQSFTRRESVGARSPTSLFFFNAPRETIVVGAREPRPRRDVQTPKYGCPFCFAVGRTLDDQYGDTAFLSGHDLAEHIGQRHSSRSPPSPLMLERYGVGVAGRVPERARRWDLNLR